MTSADVALVQGSFRKIVPIADQAAALFYARLFELDPALRALFGGSMLDQGRTWMAILSNAVASLENIDAILPAVRELAQRHGGDRVFEEHYASVGAALIWTLQKGLGPEFTPAVCAAWTDTYTVLATTLIHAQRGAEVAA